jgi:hypothetical protein
MLRKFNLYIFAAVILLSACAEEQKHASEDKHDEMLADTVATDKETIEEEEVSFMLPSPIQIAAIFNRAGLKFESGLANPPSNISTYNTKTSKYLNFGIYSADLAYAVMNEQQQLSIDYLNAVKKLADDIGMPSVFGTGKLVESFEKNIGNQDTILRILTTIKRRTDQYLEENAEDSKEAIFFSSAWVEGMYLGAKSGKDNQKITPRLVEQMTILDNVIKALETQSDPSLEIGFVIDGLKDIRSSFENYEGVQKMQSEKLDLDQVKLTDKELQDLTQKITDLRNQIIKG